MKVILFLVKIGYHSRFNPECNIEKDFKKTTVYRTGVEKEEVKTLPAEQSQLEKCGIEEKFVRSFDLDKK